MFQGSRRCAVLGGALLLVLAGTGPGTALAQCVGDCDGNGAVSAGEVQIGVQIALLQETAPCAGFGEEVHIDDLVRAVGMISAGCGTPMPTPTSTATATPATTSTPGGVSNAAAGSAAIVARSLGGIPDLITAIVTGLTKGMPTTGRGIVADTCPAGGNATRDCTEPVGGGAQLSLGFHSCAVSVPAGTLTFNSTLAGPMMLTSPSPATCPAGVSPLALPINATIDVSAITRDLDTNILLNSRPTVTAVLTPNFTATACRMDGAQMTLTGPLTSAIPGNPVMGTILNFLQTNVGLSIATFNADCALLDYTLTFNGQAQIQDTMPQEEKTAVTFDDFVVHVDASGVPAKLDMSGTLNFDCLQGNIVFDTIEALTSIPGQICPTGGLIHLTTPEGPGAVDYVSDGSVEIDVDNDGTFDNDFASCIEPMLQLCPAQP